MDVLCLAQSGNTRSKNIARAMVDGINASGDRPEYSFQSLGKQPVVVSYGWKRNKVYRQHPSFIYADLGYWNRDEFYRFSVNGWSPEGYVRSGLSASRFEAQGLRIKPWRTKGRDVVVAGCSLKSAQEHGFPHMEWERQAIRKLKTLGLNVVWRPKPNDRYASPLEGLQPDRRPISEVLDTAHGWVTHHSNSAVDALLAGVPVYCETGAAAAFSVPLESMESPELRPGREQFLYDVAWLQWSVAEMRSGECWRHLRGLL